MIGQVYLPYHQLGIGIGGLLLQFGQRNFQILSRPSGKYQTLELAVEPVTDSPAQSLSRSEHNSSVVLHS